MKGLTAVYSTAFTYAVGGKSQSGKTRLTKRKGQHKPNSGTRTKKTYVIRGVRP